MSKSEKVYVIDPVKPARTRNRRAAPKDSETQIDADDALTAGARGAADESAQLDRLDEKGSPAFAFFSYLFGPLSILATRRGRRSKPWVWIAALSSAAIAVLVAFRAYGIFPLPEQKFDVQSFIALAGLCAAIVVGFASWVRGVLLVGRSKKALLRRLPDMVRHPAALGAIGFLVPGFGLHASGFPRRAACALWGAASAVVSALALSQAPALWRWNEAATGLAFRPDALEIAFIVLAATGLLGAFAWIVQALDGIRLAEREMKRESQPRGDLAAMALLASIAIFLTAFQPADLARDIDRFVLSARQDGFRIIPLYAADAAMRLDPSRPEYALQAIEINERLGREDRAAEIRRDLAERWHAYEQSMRVQHSSMQP